MMQRGSTGGLGNSAPIALHSHSLTMLSDLRISLSLAHQAENQFGTLDACVCEQEQEIFE